MEKLNEDQFYKMVSELMDTVKCEAMQRAKSVWVSGAIDKEKYEDNYCLPKYYVTAFLHSWDGFRPLTDDGREEVKNIELVI